MIRFYKDGFYIHSLVMDISTAIRVVDILCESTGANWSFKYKS